jgi:hypothetical protein
VLNSSDPTPYCVTQPDGFGLLLDVDGPISSPITRTVSQPGLLEALVTLANSGVPIAFNTGRGDDFLVREVSGPLYAAGMHEDALVWGIGEKGGTWFRFGSPEQLVVDENLIVPDDVRQKMQHLAEGEFSDLVFFDDSKRTMVSLEQRLDITLDGAVAQIVLDAGFDISWHGNISAELKALETDPAVNGNRTNYRIDSSVLATDVEHSRTGKDIGARRFIDLLLEQGITPPQRWFTMGDSRSDYKMTDWLFAHGFTASHVDVRPSEQLPQTDYPVLTHPSLIFDEAGEFFLSAWARKVA